MADASLKLTADVSELNSAIKSQIDGITEIARKQNETNDSIENSLKRQSNERKKATENAKKGNDETKKELGLIQKLEKELLDLNKARKQANNVEDIKKYNDQLKITEKELKDLNNATNKTVVSTNKLSNSGSRVSKLGGAFKEIGGSVTGFLLSPIGLAVAAIGGLVAGFKRAVNVQSEFQQSLKELQSITGVTNEELEFYRQTAKDIATDRTLSTNINETVNAFKLVGSAKPELLGAKEDLAEVTKQAILLSKASGDTLESSVGSLTATLNQFNLGAEDSGKVINILAAGSKEGAAAIPQITEAITKFGVSARSSNISVEESVAAIEVLAEKGLQGAEAGTKLRNVFAKLSATEVLPKEATLRLEAAGINTQLLSDTSLTLQERLEVLKPIQSDANTLTALFGLQNKDAAQAVLENTDRLGELVESVTDTSVAYAQAQNNTNTYQGALNRLGNSFDALLAGSGSLVDGLAPLINALADFIGMVELGIEGLQEWDLRKISTSTLGFIDTITYGVTGIGELVEETERYINIVDDVVDSVQSQVNGLDTLTTSYKENEEQINSGLLTEEESNRLKEENERIVGRLNEKYPEFTKLVDIQTASTDELTRATKQYTNALIDQAIQEAQSQERAEKVNTLIQKQIELQKVRAKGESSFTEATGGIFGTREKELEDEINQLRKDINNIGDAYSEAGEEIKGYGLELQTSAKVNIDLLEEAQSELKRLELKLFLPFGDKDVLNEQIKAQKQFIEKLKSDRQEALDKELGVNLDKEVEATKKEEEEKAKIRKSARNKRESEELKQAKKLADERRKILEDSENEYNKNIADLLDQRTELYAESEADKILLEESRALQSIDNLKANILEEQALLKLASDRGQKFVEQATQEELNAELEKYRQIVTLTSEQEEAIRDLKLDVSNRTQQDLLALELQNQSELLSLSEETTNKKLQLQEQLENSAIERINNNEELSEVQKEANILQIRQDGLEQRKALIEEETRLKNEQINKEIELLKSLNTEESNLKIQSLEVQKEINNQQLSDQIQSYDNQIEAGKQAVIEAQQVAEQSTLDNAIGKIFGVDSPEQIQAIKDTFKTLVDNLVSIYSQGLQRQLESNERLIDGINQRIDEQESAVDREIQKNEEGNASSIALEEEKLANLQEQRDNALKQQEEIIRRQQQLEDLQQLSALITC